MATEHPKECPNCRKLNKPDARFCECGMPLSLEALARTKEEQEEYVRKIARMVYDELEERERSGKLKKPGDSGH